MAEKVRLMDFLQKTLVTEATIGEANLHLVRLTDSMEEALAWISASTCRKGERPPEEGDKTPKEMVEAI